MLTADLGRTIQLEGCLGGNVPQGAKPYGGASSPCAGLAKLKPAHVVYGPGTFLNESVTTVQNAMLGQFQAEQRTVQQAVDAARATAKAQGLDAPSSSRPPSTPRRSAAQQQATTDLERLALSSGIQGIPQIDSKPFISQIVFDPARGADVPKARFAYLFPNRDAALIQVRLRPELSATRSARRAIALVRAAVADADVRLPARRHATPSAACRSSPTTSRATVTSGIALLLGAAVVAMALALLLVFRARLRLLPLLVALAAAGLTFGAMALAGVALTMASIAVLPVLIGLAVDYAIQFQSRVEEERERSDPPCRPARPPRRSRARRAPARRRSPPPRSRRRPASSCCCSRPCRWCAASACCS